MKEVKRTLSPLSAFQIFKYCFALKVSSVIHSEACFSFITYNALLKNCLKCRWREWKLNHIWSKYPYDKSFSKRRVWKVQTPLWDYYSTLSSTRDALRVWPHDLCVAHGLIDAGESTHGFLHHLLPHTEHVVLLKELIGQLCHTQTGVDLLHRERTRSYLMHFII